MLDAASAIAINARAAAAEIESTQRLPLDLVRQMADAGLFQMYVRQSVGGPGTDPLTAYRAVETLAIADASVAWLSMVASGCAWLTGWLAEDVLREMRGDPCDLRIAGSYRPLGRARPVAGGYRARGRWDFASGILHANWVIACCVIEDESTPPRLLIMFVPATEVTVEHTWSVVGMRGTGSHHIVLDEVFVPEERAVLPVGNAPAPDAIYSQRLLRVCTFGPVAAVMIGAALGAIDDVIAMANRSSTLSTISLRDRPEVQRAVADATARIHSARSYLVETIAAAHDAVVRDVEPTAAVGACRLAIVHASHQATRAIATLIDAVGTPSIHLSNPIQRRARDVMVAQHFPSFDLSNYENAGRVLFGLEPSGEGW
jgi:alkylation response protein AidB-like acyl-CoA dehydrogenase